MNYHDKILLENNIGLYAFLEASSKTLSKKDDIKMQSTIIQLKKNKDEKGLIALCKKLASKAKESGVGTKLLIGGLSALCVVLAAKNYIDLKDAHDKISDLSLSVADMQQRKCAADKATDLAVSTVNSIRKQVIDLCTTVECISNRKAVYPNITDDQVNALQEYTDKLRDLCRIPE